MEKNLSKKKSPNVPTRDVNKGKDTHNFYVRNPTKGPNLKCEWKAKGNGNSTEQFAILHTQNQKRLGTISSHSIIQIMNSDH